MIPFFKTTHIESYKFLSELFLNRECAFSTFYYKQMDPQIICEMLESMGSDWIPRFLNSESRSKFSLVNRHFLPDGALNGKHQRQFVTTITSTRTNTIGETKVLTFPLKLLKWIADVLGDNGLKDFLLRDDGNGAFIIRVLLREDGIDFAYTSLAYFSDESMKQQIVNYMEKEGPQVIKEKIFSQHRNKNMLIYVGHCHLLFYLEHADKKQLETFVQDVTATGLIGASICSYTHYAILKLKKSIVLNS